MSSNLNLIFSQFNFNVASNSERVTYVFGEYRLDAAHRMLYRGEEELVLPPKAIETLLALLVRRGEIVSKDELMKIIWAGTAVEESNLSQYLHVLRKTLGRKGDGKPFIETLRRRGYRFDAEVQVVEEQLKSKAENDNPLSQSFHPPQWENHRAHADYKTDNNPSARAVVNAWINSSLVFAAVTFASVFALTTFLYFQFQPTNNSRPNRKGEMSITYLTNGNFASYPTISPDGKYFVYHEKDGEIAHLWLQQTGQSNRIEIIPPAARAIFGKTFSLNGEFIYFLTMEKDETQLSLFRVPTLGGAIIKILTDVSSPVSFSPDGREMVFMRYEEESRQYHLIIAASDGTKERILLTRSGTESLSIGNAWSPDGQTIAFGTLNINSPSGEGSCLLMSAAVQTGAVKPLSNEKWDTCFRMVWTPDGEGVVFIGTRAGESYTTRRDQVYYLSAATGEVRRVSTDTSRYQDWGLGVTNDNSIIAVPHTRSSQIWAMNANGDSRTATQLTTGMGDGRGGIATLPDGRIGYITRVGEDLTVWTMNADGTNQQQITSEPSFIEELRATPDGRYFIFSARRDGYSHLYRIDVDGSNLKQITGGESYEIDSTVSPDGNWLLYGSIFFADNRLIIKKTSLNNGETIDLGGAAGHLKQVNLHYSPDGKFISNVTGDKLMILDAETFQVVKTFETFESPSLHIGARWTPDGKYLTYIAGKKTVSNIWKQPVDGGKPQRLTDFTSGEIYNYAFSADGLRLYLARGYQIRNAVLIKNFK